MTGIQLSAAYAVMQAADFLTAADSQEERDAGKGLRCCEVTSLMRVPEEERVPGTQGVQVSLRFYEEEDLEAVDKCFEVVEYHIARAFGIWGQAVQIEVDLLSDKGSWIGVSRPTRRGGTGLRLNRYFDDDVLEELKENGSASARGHLTDHEGEVKILLRRLRYRLAQDYGDKHGQESYSYWSTPTTRRWAEDGNHKLNYLVHKLSHYSDDLQSGNADDAGSLDVAYSGEIDTERDPLVVTQVTTSSGSTRQDVENVLERAGRQIKLGKVVTVPVDKNASEEEPLTLFIEKLEELLEGSFLKDTETDVLLIHRGGGVNPKTRWNKSNVSDEHRRELLALCKEVRDLGIEVVVGIGHANISVLKRVRKKHLPLGIFEATTPTAAAAWILQEHINPRLVDTSLLYSQGVATRE